MFYQVNKRMSQEEQSSVDTYANKLSRLRDTILFQNIQNPPHVQYRINLLLMIIMGNLAMTIISIIFTMFGDVSDSNRSGGAVIVLIVVAVHLWALSGLQRGNTKMGSYIVVGTVWVSLALMAYGSGGIYSSGMMGIMSLLVTGSLLLDRRGVTLLFVGTLLYFWLLLGIELSGNLPPSPFKDLSLRIMVLSVTATSLFIFVRYHVYALLQSERKAAQLQLLTERKNRQRVLTQNLAHDLRTPIAILKTSTYLIRKQIERGLPVEEQLSRLEKQSNKLNDMIDALFQLTQLESELESFTLQVIDIAPIIDGCVEYNQPLARLHNITIRPEYDRRKTYSILGSQEQFARAIDNLIQNAIQYGQEDGNITVSMQKINSTIQIEIEDDGIGIALEHHALIFDRFYRVNEARTSTQFSGTGIGLDVVQQIIKLHNGNITLRSALGEGTTFIITVPEATSRL